MLCDRFDDSTMVYQGFVRGIEISKVQDLCKFAADDVQPELTILLDAAPEALLQRRADRGVQDRFEQEGLDFQKKVREGFLLLANAEPARVKKVHALQSAEAVQEDIRKILVEAGF